jgi:hypothetical protein
MHFVRSVTLWPVVVLGITAGLLEAQAAPDSAGHPRIWVRTRVAPFKLDRGIKGVLLRTSGDTLFMLTEAGATVPIPFGSEQRYFISKGRRPQVLPGTLIGLGVGLAAGAAFIGGSGDDPLFLRHEGAAIGAAGGALIGALVGLAVRGEAWRETPVQQLRVSLIPHGLSGIGLRLSAPLR